MLIRLSGFYPHTQATKGLLGFVSNHEFVITNHQSHDNNVAICHRPSANDDGYLLLTIAIMPIEIRPDVNVNTLQQCFLTENLVWRRRAA